MPRVVHIVVTENFAGVERYIADISAASSLRGWDVTVIGGHPTWMPEALDHSITWRPGGTITQAVRSLRATGCVDICHAHMTAADIVAVFGRQLHRGRIVATRHFAQQRGSQWLTRRIAPSIARQITCEIAISTFVADVMEHAPDAVIQNGVPCRDATWSPTRREVLLLQRLEPEKDTPTALRAWAASGLWADGWSLRVVGEGSERERLADVVAREHIDGVTFAGFSTDPQSEYARAGMMIAPAHREPFGLSVCEAMMAGVPVVAAAGGGHLETIGQATSTTLFPPGDAIAAARLLRALADDDRRAVASRAVHEYAQRHLGIDASADQLIATYEQVLHLQSGASLPPALRHPDSLEPDIGERSGLRELVVCSLEPWDEVWRRNQFFVDGLLTRHPNLRVLFVEPAADPVHALTRKTRPSLVPRVRSPRADGRLITYRPVKPCPRRLGAIADHSLHQQVRRAMRRYGFRNPVVWVNDVTYAELMQPDGWPSVYDITDDWLLADRSLRERERLRRGDAIALRDADTVIVCSPNLVVTRGATRDVVLIPNGVNVAHFERPQPRPTDLPHGPTAIYAGTLYEDRLDVDLVCDIARELGELTLVFVGPNALSQTSHARLAAHPNIIFLGAHPHDQIAGYLQHADVIIVPHVVTPFTERLDPIKAYECLAVHTPTVATPVAGFREHASEFSIAPAHEFVDVLWQVLISYERPGARASVHDWSDRIDRIDQCLAELTSWNAERRSIPEHLSAPERLTT